MLMLLAARGSSCMACGRKRHFFGVHNALLKPKTLLDDQIAVMRSMRIYREERPEKDVLLMLPEDVVQQILEFLANRQQLQILKALAVATHVLPTITTHRLSRRNLLFHLSKLVACGMILQRNERGDYMITERGTRFLREWLNFMLQ